MSDDLVKRLRAFARHPMMDNNCKADVFDVSEAADLIESLTSERDRWCFRADALTARIEAAEEELMAAQGQIADAQAAEARVKELEGQLQSMSILAMEVAVEATQEKVRVKELEGALLHIDTLDPESKVDGCSPAALRGLVLRMGEIARDTLKKGHPMSDPTPHARRSPMEHERDAGGVSLLQALRDMTDLAIQLGAIDTEVEHACAAIERAQGGAAYAARGQDV